MEKQICKNCTYYTAYYKQWADNYSKLNNGFCLKHQNHTKQLETCGEHKSNEIKEKRREKMRFDALDKALKSINDIAQILREKEKNG